MGEEIVVDPVVDPVAPVVDPVTPVDPAPVVPEVAPVTDPVIPEVKPTEGTIEAVTEDIKFDGVKYGEYDVEISIPVEVANFAAENGLDAKAISEELYGSTDFTLGEETMNTLYEKFGKWQVDAYLGGIKAKNDALVGDHKTNTTAAEEASTKAWESTMEMMGGEDRWDDMSAYAAQNLSEGDLAEFNAVMESGSLRMQQLMIKDVWGQFDAAGAPVAPVTLDLEDGSNSGDPVGDPGGAVTAAQFKESFANGEYRKDPALWDKRRRAGMAKGI